MTAVFNPTCFRGISLRLSPPLPISQPTLRHRRFSVAVMSSSSPIVTLNTYTSPKSYSHSRFRVRADCSAESVSGSTGDDDHRQNDICNSCTYGAGLSENDMKKPQVAVSWDEPNTRNMHLLDLSQADKEAVAEGHTQNDICNSCPDRVPFPADLKPSGKNVMEHFHKETIRPVGDPSGAVPDIQVTYPAIAVALLKRGRSCLEVAVALLRRGVTYLEAVVGILRRVMAFLEAVIVLLG